MKYIKVFFLFLIYFFLTIIISSEYFTFWLEGKFFNNTYGSYFIVQWILLVLDAISVILLVYVMLGFSFKKLFDGMANPIKDINSWRFFAFIVFVSSISVVSVFLIDHFSFIKDSISKSDFHPISPGMIKTRPFFFLFLTKAFLAGPFFEELFFRKGIMDFLGNKKNYLFVILFSSILFAFAHIHKGMAIPAFLIGIILSAVYLRFGFFASFLLHAVINLINAFVVPSLYKTLFTIFPENLMTIAVIVFIFSALMLVIIIRKILKEINMQTSFQ